MIYSKLRYGDMTMGTILLPSLQLYVKEPSLRLLQGYTAPPSSTYYQSYTRIVLRCSGIADLQIPSTEFQWHALVSIKFILRRPSCRSDQESSKL